MKNYSDAVGFLEGLQLFGAVLGLDNPRRLAALAGNPQEKLRFIHVAGTNGKGSTCAMLEAIYRAAGLRVGLYTSPHLIAFGERIQVDRQPIAEADVVRLVGEMKGLLEQFSADRHPTFFEVVTIMALRHFANQQCDLVIWETGLGGRLDATNIVTPLASVITNVQFDHQSWLGDTLAKIAAEKAGIIKPGVPVITGADAPDARAVIRQTAAGQGAPLSEADETQIADLKSQISLRGAHQRRNAVVAVATVAKLQPLIPVSAEAIRHGLSSVRWAGRFQVIERPGQTFLLDGAHNPDGAATLAAGLREYFPSRSPALVIGVLKDKDAAALCGLLAPLAHRVVAAPVESGRTATPADLLAACHQAHPNAQLESAASLRAALTLVATEPFVVVTGSLYFVGEALALLDPTGRPTDNERGLNEWTR